MSTVFPNISYKDCSIVLYQTMIKPQSVNFFDKEKQLFP